MEAAALRMLSTQVAEDITSVAHSRGETLF